MSNMIPAEENQSSLDKLPMVHDWLSQILDVQKYFATRRAIMSNMPLWQYPVDKLRTLGFQTAWNFNLEESTLAALPAILMTGFVEFLYSTQPIQSQATLQFLRYFPEIFGSVAQLCWPFVPPLFLTLFAYLAGWASLRKEDRNKENIQRNVAAYLYFDGAFGLWPQMSLTFLLVALLWASTHAAVEIQMGMTILWVVVGIPVALYSAHLLYQRIPSKLFALQGYALNHRSFFWQKKGENEGPWQTWSYAAACGPYVILFALTSLIVFAAFGIAFTLAIVKYALMGG